jgi:hypothetical protein|nr:MAG TPA: restriction endonuclease [Caudoviricetes sp.]
MPTTAKKPGRKPTGAKKAGRPKPKVEEPSYLCPYCNTVKKRSEYYVSTDPLVRTGVTNMCKDCAKKIARNYDPKTGQYGDCTKESIIEALERLDKPFFENLFNSSYVEGNDPSNRALHGDTWEAYIKNICSLKQYKTLRWHDGDIGKRVNLTSDDSDTYVVTEDRKKEIEREYAINRKDAIRIIGYDPFAKYPIEEDKPVLYAQLISFIDDETKNDGMKMNAVIQIVKAFNQIQKINDAIDKLSSNISKLNNNNGIIKQHADTISKLLSGANALAKDNGISINYNNSKSKGQNTLTGKMKELDLIGFRNAKINTYDIDYCRGMQQVAEISAKAQIDQIGFDENVMNEIGNIRRELVDSLTKERDKAQERARVLLVENKDLKDFLKGKGFIDENGQVVDNE